MERSSVIPDRLLEGYDSIEIVETNTHGFAKSTVKEPPGNKLFFNETKPPKRRSRQNMDKLPPISAMSRKVCLKSRAPKDPSSSNFLSDTDERTQGLIRDARKIQMGDHKKQRMKARIDLKSNRSNVNELEGKSNVVPDSSSSKQGMELNSTEAKRKPTAPEGSFMSIGRLSAAVSPEKKMDITDGRSSPTEINSPRQSEKKRVTKIDIPDDSLPTLEKIGSKSQPAENERAMVTETSPVKGLEKELFFHTRSINIQAVQRKMNEIEKALPMQKRCKKKSFWNKVRDEHGNSLLICAAQSGSKKLCKLFLRAGIDPGLRNYKRCQAHDYASKYKYKSLCNYLKSKTQRS